CLVIAGVEHRATGGGVGERPRWRDVVAIDHPAIAGVEPSGGEGRAVGDVGRIGRGDGRRGFADVDLRRGAGAVVIGGVRRREANGQCLVVGGVEHRAARGGVGEGGGRGGVVRVVGGAVGGVGVGGGDGGDVGVWGVG